jgi:hypothetical protein
MGRYTIQLCVIKFVNYFRQVGGFPPPPHNIYIYILYGCHLLLDVCRGGSRGGVHPTHAPLKLEKIWFFGVKSWFFTRNTPTIFAPPSARRNFFKCAPLTWNLGSAPGLYNILYFLWLYNELFIILYNILKIAELDCCQIIILSIYVPSTHAYTHVLRLSLDLPYEKR